MYTFDADRTALCWAVLSNRQRRAWQFLAAGTEVSVPQARVCARAHLRASLGPWALTVLLLTLAGMRVLEPVAVLYAGAAASGVFASLTVLFSVWFRRLARRLAGHVPAC